MDQGQSTFRGYVPFVFAMISIGWGGLYLLLNYSLPFVWARWGFFALVILALTGIALPVVYFFHQRFPADPPAGQKVIVRQSLWVGVYGATLAWLQLGRLVSLYVILGLAGGFVAAEYFIRLRESASRHPPAVAEEEEHADPA
ncbi:MAG: hypothetical protein FJZ87_07950 [Chloroflexi bacterium]|nr:hypothetical protein [Chloroflexota bacterium]